eukprot:TRINITY_DN2859_c0_g1_i1.p1 TRINITY_DN2859_c0_g1~~TRINITY_DN2859_c0_g1_i1.p1  ORF type:complete len:155 (+),score=34.73 TRINITY_DN2859_c0_g1_i1:50-514(+)
MGEESAPSTVNVALQVILIISVIMSLIVLAITAAARSSVECSVHSFTYTGKLDEATVGMNISTSIFTFIAVAFGFFVLRFKTEKLFVLIFAGASLLLWIFWLTSWALYAHQVNDYNKYCTSDRVRAGFAFSFITWLLWTVGSVLTGLVAKEFID